jgi:hypothetical protein
MTYHKTVSDLRPLYLSLVQKYRVVIYRFAATLSSLSSQACGASAMLTLSGDADACVPYYGSQEWTRELGLTLKQAWRCVFLTLIILPSPSLPHCCAHNCPLGLPHRSPWKSGSVDKPNDPTIKAGYVITYEVKSLFSMTAFAFLLPASHKPLTHPSPQVPASSPATHSSIPSSSCFLASHPLIHLHSSSSAHRRCPTSRSTSRS